MKRRVVAPLVLLGVSSFVLLSSGPASAASVIAKDGKIHACYKAKGKGKGTLRVVRSAKARCPKRWKKVAWYAAPPAGTQGESGTPGGSGAAGLPGERGVSGAAGNVVVKELEDKVTELLTKVKSLEAVVQSLCTQATGLTAQSNDLGDSLEGLNMILNTLLVAFVPVSVPSVLPPYSCPG
jgi:hypothetical protein